MSQAYQPEPDPRIPSSGFKPKPRTSPFRSRGDVEVQLSADLSFDGSGDVTIEITGLNTSTTEGPVASSIKVYGKSGSQPDSANDSPLETAGSPSTLGSVSARCGSSGATYYILVATRYPNDTNNHFFRGSYVVPSSAESDDVCALASSPS